MAIFTYKVFLYKVYRSSYLLVVLLHNGVLNKKKIVITIYTNTYFIYTIY